MHGGGGTARKRTHKQAGLLIGNWECNNLVVVGAHLGKPPNLNTKVESGRSILGRGHYESRDPVGVEDSNGALKTK
jgi:hypothetical protein